MEKEQIQQRKTETMGNFEKALTLEEQAERSTLMDEMRAEVANLYDEVVTLIEQAQTLKEKNEKLVEANTELFTRVGYTKEDPKEKQKKSEGLSLDGII